MKRGDIIGRDVIKDIGSPITGSGRPAEVEQLIKDIYEKENKPIPKYRLIPLEETIIKDNPGLLGQVEAVRDEIEIYHEEAKVNWVIDGACAIQYKDGSCNIFELVDEPEWKVLIESIPSYQSSVENLSDEDLRKAIDDLRAQRTFVTTKPKRAVTKRETADKNDPMAIALASMTPEKREELMRKLGMVD